MKKYKILCMLLVGMVVWGVYYYGKNGVMCKAEVVSLDYDAEQDETTVETVFTWEWEKCPFVLQEDIVSIAVSNEMYLKEENSYVEVSYGQKGEAASMTKTYTLKPQGPGLAICVFDMKAAGQAALEGKATLVWTKDGKQRQCSTFAKYGHSTGFDKVDSQSILEETVTILGEDYGYKEIEY